MPPRVQRSWVAGSGAKVMVCFSAGARRVIEDDAGLDARDAARGVYFKDGPMYFEKSRTTAAYSIARLATCLRRAP